MDLLEAPPASVDVPPGEEPPRPLRHLSDGELEERLAGLAGRIAATQAGFMAHVLELDARVEHGYQGARSSAQWLSWRLGIGIGTARQHVRVARALWRLPLIAAAFGSGRLSYCKVRAITRVATAGTEGELLAVALGCTGSQLERAVRLYRSVATAECSAAATLRRRVTRRVEHDGSLVFTIRVPPDEGAVLDQALDAALRVVLDEDGDPVEVPEETRLAAQIGAQPPIVRAQADAFVLLAESFLATGPVGDRGTGLEVLVHADLDQLIEATRDQPAQHQPAEHQPAQHQPAEHQPAQHQPAEREPAAGSGPDGEMAQGARQGGIHSADGQPLLAATALRRLCETSMRLMAHAPDGTPIDLGRTARDASLRQRRVLHERDRHCRFPGCTQRRRLIPHHVTWWSRGGRTDLDNLVSR